MLYILRERERLNKNVFLQRVSGCYIYWEREREREKLRKRHKTWNRFQFRPGQYTDRIRAFNEIFFTHFSEFLPELFLSEPWEIRFHKGVQSFEAEVDSGIWLIGFDLSIKNFGPKLLKQVILPTLCKKHLLVKVIWSKELLVLINKYSVIFGKNTYISFNGTSVLLPMLFD